MSGMICKQIALAEEDHKSLSTNEAEQKLSDSRALREEEAWQ